MMEFDKEALIRTIAKDASFTIKDIRIIFDTLENCIYQIAKSGDTLRWHRIGTMYTKDVDEYAGWNPIDKKPMVVQAHRRIYMSPSKVLHNYINDIENSEEDKQ